MSTNFPGPPHTMGFVAFSCAMGNWWDNPCISHMMKYIIGLESDGKKVPILWEKYDYQFPRFSLYNGFCCIFPYYGKSMGKSMHFPYDEVYHRMGKNYPYYGKSMITNFLGFPHTMGFVAFSHAVGNWWEIPCISHMMRFVNFFLYNSRY